MKSICSFIILSLSSMYLFSQSIINVTDNLSPQRDVGIYEKVEVSLNLNGFTFTNPYDHTDIHVYAHFWLTSNPNVIKVVDGFYYQEYSRSVGPTNCPYQEEVMTAVGDPTWKIRFAPDEIGEWNYTIYAEASNPLRIAPVMGPYSYESFDYGKKGFIQKKDSRFFKHANGDSFVPIGINLNGVDYKCNTNYSFADYRYGSYQFEHYMDNMEANGMNSFRMFCNTPGRLSLYGHDYAVTPPVDYFDNTLNQKDAAELDYIIEYAESKDVFIQLVLFVSHMLSDGSFAQGSWTGINDQGNDKGWGNPFNAKFGGPIANDSPHDFFDIMNTNSIRIQKNLVQYFISRWGYSQNVMAWELFNEADGFATYEANLHVYDPITNPIPSYLDTYIEDWHIHMSDFIKSNDPNRHLITTSFTTNYNHFMNQPIRFHRAFDHNNIEFLSLHYYSWPRTPGGATTDFENFLHDFTTTALNAYTKPIHISEAGTEDMNNVETTPNWYHKMSFDPLGYELHSNLWAGLFSGAIGPYFNWGFQYIDNFYADDHARSGHLSRDLYHQFQPISNFISQIETSDELSSTKLNSNGLRTHYLHDDEKAYGWVQDDNFRRGNIFTDINDPKNNHYLYDQRPIFRPTAGTDNTINLGSEFDKGWYKVEWYSSEWNVSLISTESVLVNPEQGIDDLIINMPTSLRTSKYGDAVFKAELDCDKSIWAKSKVDDYAYAKGVKGNIVSTSDKVFYTTSTGALNGIHWNGTIWEHTNFDNVVSSGVDGHLAISSDGRIYYKTTNGGINYIYWDNGNWHHSTTSGVVNNVNGALTVSPRGPIFYRTSGNKINYIEEVGGVWQASTIDYSYGHGSKGNIVAHGDHLTFTSFNLSSTNNSLLGVYWNGSIWAFTNYDNKAPSIAKGNIAVGSQGIFFRNTSDRINLVYWNGSGWDKSDLDFSSVNVAGGITIGQYGKVYYRTHIGELFAIYESSGQWLWSSLDNAASNAFGSMHSTPYGVFYENLSDKMNLVAYIPSCDVPDFRERNSSIDDLSEDDNSIRIYPNPTNGIFTIEMGNLSPSLITIYNITGAVIKEVNSDQNDGASTAVLIDLTDQSSGVYYIQIRQEGRLLSKKIIKQ